MAYWLSVAAAETRSDRDPTESFNRALEDFMKLSQEERMALCKSDECPLSFLIRVRPFIEDLAQLERLAEAKVPTRSAIACRVPIVCDTVSLVEMSQRYFSRKPAELHCLVEGARRLTSVERRDYFANRVRPWLSFALRLDGAVWDGFRCRVGERVVRFHPFELFEWRDSSYVCIVGLKLDPDVVLVPFRRLRRATWRPTVESPTRDRTSDAAARRVVVENENTPFDCPGLVTAKGGRAHVRCGDSKEAVAFVRGVT